MNGSTSKPREIQTGRLPGPGAPGPLRDLSGQMVEIFKKITAKPLGFGATDLSGLGALSRLYQPEGVLAAWEIWMGRDGLKPRYTETLRYPVAAFLQAFDMLIDNPDWAGLRDSYRPPISPDIVNLVDSLSRRWVDPPKVHPQSKLEFLKNKIHSTKGAK